MVERKKCLEIITNHGKALSTARRDSSTRKGGSYSSDYFAYAVKNELF